MKTGHEFKVNGHRLKPWESVLNVLGIRGNKKSAVIDVPEYLPCQK
jgi:hypothetical protein